MNLVQRPKPIANQVTEILTDRIRTHEYAPGSRLPSESDLAIELRVSRATIRSALAKMAGEGLVVRRQGDGTYVNENIVQVPTRMGGMWDFLRLIEHSGHQPTTTLLSSKERSSTQVESDALRIDLGEPVLALRRLFCADGDPVILVESVIPVGLILYPVERETGALPINELLRQHCDQTIAYTIVDIHAEIPERAVRRLLQLEGEIPLLRLQQVFFNHSNLPILYSTSCYNDKILSLRLVHTWS